MRHIEKVSPPEEYTKYVRNNKPKDWNSVSGEMRDYVRMYILEFEQGMLSAYTEKLLDTASYGLHVDHFVKQKFMAPQQTLEWQNLFVDAHSKEYGADHKDNGKKCPLREKADYQWLINPADEDPHHYFCYDVLGNIRPRDGLSEIDTQKAIFTIETFNLQHKTLVQERSCMIQNIKDYKNGGFDAATTKNFLQCASFPSLVEYFCDNFFDAF